MTSPFNFNIPAELMPSHLFQPPLIDPAIFRDHNLADAFHERLVKSIAEFDADLDAEHEVGVRLVSFGQTVTFRLLDLSYWNPALMIFYGETEDGQPVQLIQHVTQISILLTKLKVRPGTTKRPLGFTPPAPEGTEPR